MSAELEPRLQVEPVITLPERVSPGQVAIVEVGLRVCEPQHWPYAEDSFRFGCMLDGAPDFVVESIDRHDITLTRDGLGDDPIRFAVTAQWSVQGSRSLWLSLTTDHGVVVRTYESSCRWSPSRVIASRCGKAGRSRCPRARPRSSADR